MAVDRQDSPYRRGNRYELMPIPMVPEHCITVAAGAVNLLVESRQLTDQILADTYPDGEAPDAAVHFDDFGASLHVCGADDGIEYLRFDCFENEPHYHYIYPEPGANTIVRIDELALGDPIDFTLACVLNRLPEMLANTGAVALVDTVRGQGEQLSAAVAEVRSLMERARGPVA
jgi:hypothetical protein